MLRIVTPFSQKSRHSIVPFPLPLLPLTAIVLFWSRTIHNRDGAAFFSRGQQKSCGRCKKKRGQSSLFISAARPELYLLGPIHQSSGRTVDVNRVVVDVEEVEKIYRVEQFVANHDEFSIP